jgi:hypothetical protein
MDALGPLADGRELPRRPLQAGCATLAPLTGRARRPRRALKADGAVYARRPDFSPLPALPRGSLWPWHADPSRWSRRAGFAVFDFGQASSDEIGNAERECGDLGAELGDREITRTLPFATLVREDLAEGVGPVVRQRV